jgi:hypothetical protein
VVFLLGLYPEISGKYWVLRFFALTTASFCKHLIITLVFEESAKIVIITSTPGLPDADVLDLLKHFGNVFAHKGNRSSEITLKKHSQIFIPNHDLMLFRTTKLHNGLGQASR